MRKHLFGPFLLQKQQMESVFPGDETCCSSVIQDGSLLNIQLNKLVLFCSPPPEIQFKRMPSLPTRHIEYLFHRTVNRSTYLHRQMRIRESCTSEQKAQSLEKYHLTPKDTWVQSFTSVSDRSQRGSWNGIPSLPFFILWHIWLHSVY